MTIQRNKHWRATLMGAACLALASAGLVGAAAAKDTVRVRIAEYSTNTGPFFIEMADKFNASQDGIEVVIEHLPWPEMQQQLITDISAGTAPDISHMATRWMAGFAKDGALAPIDDLMSDAFAATFVPTFLDLHGFGPLQIAQLIAVCILVLLVVYGAYIAAAARARTLFASLRARRRLNRGASLAMVGAAGGIAAS